MQDICLPNV